MKAITMMNDDELLRWAKGRAQATRMYGLWSVAQVNGDTWFSTLSSQEQDAILLTFEEDIRRLRGYRSERAGQEAVEDAATAAIDDQGKR